MDDETVRHEWVCCWFLQEDDGTLWCMFLQEDDEDDENDETL
jgi:hypothetical protein